MTERISTSEKYPGFPRLNHLKPEDFPKHILIVMDGNRHWGQEHEGNKLSGHTEGAKTAIKLMRSAMPLPGEILTFWGFSADNWKREQQEVNQLMNLISNTLTQNSEELLKNGIRFIHLGRKDRIPNNIAGNLSKLEDATKDNNGKILCAAIDFGGKDQEERLIKKAVSEAYQITKEQPKISKNEAIEIFNSDWINRSRDGKGLITPADLIIRPQHFRTSDIGWLNGPSTELYLRRDLKFPDMKPSDLEDGILQFTQDKQNFGA